MWQQVKTAVHVKLVNILKIIIKKYCLYKYWLYLYTSNKAKHKKNRNYGKENNINSNPF